MAHPTAVLLVVALTESCIGEHTPHLRAFRERGSLRRLRARLPAVTCTSQACMLTGAPPSTHGIVGNGWYERESAEVRFWRQSNHLVRAPSVWDAAREREPGLTCAKVFWWHNMYSSVDLSVTPRPIYRADGRKIPDCASEPPELRDELQGELGRFPLFRFWGPAADLSSSRWIADAALHAHERSRPDLSLVYLPHLDYAFQKHGPDSAEAHGALAEIDGVVGELVERYERDGVRVVIVSEYGIEPVDTPVHVNRAFREAGLLRVRDELGLDVLDPGGCRALGVADHQVCHVYVRDRGDLGAVRAICEGLDGIEHVLDEEAQREAGIAHERSGDLVLVARSGSWCTYYHWLDDARAPDFARTVDIHRKPGYDPVELFVDPKLRFPKLALGWRLLRKRLGFRQLMDVIPLDASLVRGSHGRVETDPARTPVLLTAGDQSDGEELPIEAVRDVILDRLFSTT